MRMSAAVLQWVLHELGQQRRVALATVLTTSGSVPGKTGARLAMVEGSERWTGTVGGAGLEFKVLNRCRALLKEATRPSAEVHTFGLNKGAKGYEVTPLDSLCGGRVTLSIEVLMPMPHVLIMGGGHCGEALSRSLDALGWTYEVHDTRPEFAATELYPNAAALHANPVSAFFDGLDGDVLSSFSDVLLLGHDWSEDQERLLALLTRVPAGGTLDGRAFPRIGVIGSRSKWQAFASACREAGVTDEVLDQVVCPIGLNIGAETPEEIAVAVAGQILAEHKRVDVRQPSWRESV